VKTLLGVVGLGGVVVVVVVVVDVAGCLQL
jgi:hypothetical protein